MRRLTGFRSAAARNAFLAGSGKGMTIWLNGLASASSLRTQTWISASSWPSASTHRRMLTCPMISASWSNR